MQINVSVQDANNIICQVVPPATQTINIDRGVTGNGIASIVPVTIATFQYLQITYTNGQVVDVGPLTSTAYTATSPIVITGNTISLSTVQPQQGGTGAAGTLTGYVYGNATGAMTASTTIPNTAITGLGTMSTQNANNVAITGGTIQGVALTIDSIQSTPIGSTTPSTGAFTTLSASSTVSGTGFSTYLASPPAIGGTTANTAKFTTLAVTGLTGYTYANGSGNLTASTTIPTTALSGTVTNAQLANSSLTVNGTSISLGGSGTITAATTSTLTIGSGLSGGSFNGSAPVTIANTGVLTFSGGTTGLTPNTATNGAITLAGTLAVANGGTGVTSSSGANSVVLRDANGNVTTNCLFEGYTTQAASGTTIVLTAASVQNWAITGSGGQTIKLPDATTLPNGATFTFNNNQSSGTIVVQNNSTTTIATIQSGSYVTVVLLSNSNAAGSWDFHNAAPSNASWSTNTLNWAGSYTNGTWNGNAVGAIYGGTGQTAVTTGDLLYGSASNTWSRLGVGSTGQILRVAGGVPTWGVDYTGTVTSVAATVPSFLSISGSPITTSGTLAIGYSGTALPTANGGTGLTSFTANGVVYASSTSALTTGSALTFDGTNLSANGYINTNNYFSAAGGGVTSYYFSTATGSTFNNSAAPYLWQIGGSEYMRLTSTGLGIGTNSPSYKLDVFGASRIAYAASGNIYANVQSGSSVIQLYTDGTTNGLYSAGSAIPLTFSVNGSERARFDTGGRFMVGATSTANQNIGSFYGGAGAAGGEIDLLLYDTTSSKSIQLIRTGGTYNYAGMGATEGALYTTTNLNLVSDGGVIKFNTGTSGSAVERMRLTNAGYFGVGTTSPAAIIASSNASGTVAFRGDIGNTGTSFILSGTGSNFQVVHDGSSYVTLYNSGGSFAFKNASSNYLYYDGSGNLGLNVTPSAWASFYKAFDIGASVSFANTYGGLASVVYNAYSDSNTPTWKYKNTAPAALYSAGAASGGHAWYIAASGTAGNAISWNQALGIDNSGNLTATGTGNPTLTVNSTAGAYTSTLKLQAAAGGGSVINATGASSDILIFQITGTERARFNTSGYLGIGTNNPDSALHVTGAFNNSATSVGVRAGMYASAYAGVEMVSASGNSGWIDFHDTAGDDYIERIRAGAGSFNVYTNRSSSPNLVVNSSGQLQSGISNSYGQLSVGNTTNNAAFTINTPQYFKMYGKIISTYNTAVTNAQICTLSATTNIGYIAKFTITTVSAVSNVYNVAEGYIFNRWLGGVYQGGETTQPVTVNQNGLSTCPYTITAVGNGPNLDLVVSCSNPGTYLSTSFDVEITCRDAGGVQWYPATVNLG